MLVLVETQQPLEDLALEALLEKRLLLVALAEAAEVMAKQVELEQDLEDQETLSEVQAHLAPLEMLLELEVQLQGKVD